MNIKQPQIGFSTQCANVECSNTVSVNAHALRYAKRGILCPACVRRDKVWTKQLYAEYLKTAHWQKRRKRALERAGYRCQVCACTDMLEVHHNCYENLGGEPDVDVFVMCHKHHKLYEDNK